MTKGRERLEVTRWNGEAWECCGDVVVIVNAEHNSIWSHDEDVSNFEAIAIGDAFNAGETEAVFDGERFRFPTQEGA